MQRKTLIGTALLIQLILFSCSKDYDQFIPNSLSIDTTWTNPTSQNDEFNEFLNQITEEPLRDSIADIALGGTIKFSNNIQVQIFEKSFTDASGNPASGIAKVDLLFLSSRGQFIRNSKPTGSDGSPIQTSAEMLIRITQNGQELKLVQSKYIMVSYPEPTTYNSMFTHYGESAGPGSGYLNWTLTQDGSHATAFARPDPLEPGRTITGYDVKIKQLRWVNCGILTDTLNRSKITATLPDIFTNANTKLFVVFNDIKAVVQMNDEYSSKIFFGTNLPLNKGIRIISLSTIDSDHYLGAAEASITANSNYSIKPQKKTLAEIVEYLKKL